VQRVVAWVQTNTVCEAYVEQIVVEHSQSGFSPGSRGCGQVRAYGIPTAGREQPWECWECVGS